MNWLVSLRHPDWFMKGHTYLNNMTKYFIKDTVVSFGILWLMNLQGLVLTYKGREGWDNSPTAGSYWLSPGSDGTNGSLSEICFVVVVYRGWADKTASGKSWSLETFPRQVQAHWWLFSRYIVSQRCTRGDSISHIAINVEILAMGTNSGVLKCSSATVRLWHRYGQQGNQHINFQNYQKCIFLFLL